MRHIAPAMLRDSFIGKLTPDCRWLWLGLLLLCDDQGRIADDPDELRVSVFPYDPHITPQYIDKWLAAFAKAGKIIRYRAGGNGNGRRLIQLVKWWTYQKSAQWAARSVLPAPPRWIDRIRTHDGQQIIARNWDKEGGYSKALRTIAMRKTAVTPTKGQRRANAGATKAEDEVNTDVNCKDELRDSLPPYPPPDPGKEGRKDGGDSHTIRLNGAQRRLADQVTKILTAASFSDAQKKNSVSVLVATRSYNGTDPIAVVMAAFAHAHANPAARDPVAVAVHELEQGKRQPAFEDPKTWRSLPQSLLHAAGIDNLTDYMVTRFVRG